MRPLKLLVLLILLVLLSTHLPGPHQHCDVTQICGDQSRHRKCSGKHPTCDEMIGAPANALTDDRNVLVLVIVWGSKLPGIYVLGCVAPGNGTMSWHNVFITFRRQISSLCRTTWALLVQWRKQNPPGYYGPPRYKESFGIIALPVPAHLLWAPFEPFSTCPHCKAPWPTFRWLWAAEHCLFNSDKEGVPCRCVTFCGLECTARRYSPTITAMKRLLRTTDAPRWLHAAYSGSCPPDGFMELLNSPTYPDGFIHAA